MSRMKKQKTVRQIYEDQKDLKELRRLIRAPRPTSTIDGFKSIRGWESMSREQRAADTKRRQRDLVYSNKRGPQNTVRVTYSFTTYELGMPPPSEDDIKMMMSIKPSLAKKYKDFHPLDHMVHVPAVLTKDERPFRELWSEGRAKTKDHIIQQQIDAKEEIEQAKKKVQYNLDGPSTLDISNLTTAGDK